MMKTLRKIVLSASLAGIGLVNLPAAPLAAQENPTPLPIAGHTPPAVMRLTIEEAKHRALSQSKLLNLANLNAEGKAFAVKAAKADYFPKVTGTDLYLHFQDDLGTVLSTQGRRISGPRGTPLLSFPATTVNVPILQQNTNFAIINATQPITDLLKVRQGVKIAQADEQIALAQAEKGVRELASGVEQLYWGLLAARRIRAAAAEGVSGGELLVQASPTLEARTALVEARQALQLVDKQIADVQEQLNGLLDLPLCTILELVEPPLPLLPFPCADEAVGLALGTSPEIREAAQNVCKARAAVAAGKLDFMPSIAVVGGYVNQTAASYVQQDIGYVGVIGTCTFIDWGKRRNVVRERENLVCMANLKLEQTQDEVRQKTVKAFREVAETQQAAQTAREMVELRKEAETKAQKTAAALLQEGKKKALEEMEKVTTALLLATKARMLAEIDSIKADLAHRQAFSQLMSMVGK